MPTPAALSVLSRVSPAGGEPLHRQVEARLRRLAALPEFRLGALLPDELTMADRLGVSRGTARAALPRLGLARTTDFRSPLYDVLEREAGVIADSAREEFIATVADAGVARQLEVRAGAPLLLRCHTVLDTRKRPIEYAEVRYVSARFT